MWAQVCACTLCVHAGAVCTACCGPVGLGCVCMHLGVRGRGWMHCVFGCLCMCVYVCAWTHARYCVCVCDAHVDAPGAVCAPAHTWLCALRVSDALCSISSLHNLPQPLPRSLVEGGEGSGAGQMQRARVLRAHLARHARVSPAGSRAAMSRPVLPCPGTISAVEGGSEQWPAPEDPVPFCLCSRVG